MVWYEDPSFWVLILAVVTAMAAFIGFMLRKFQCLSRLDNKLDIIYALFKTHLAIDGKTNIHIKEFDKFFNNV